MITPPTTNASSYSHQQITQSFLQVSNSYLLVGKSSIGMQFNFVFVSHGHKNRGKPTLNLQSGEYLDFLFQTLKKTHRNLFIYLFIYNPKANEHYCIVVKMIPIYIRPPKALNGSIKEIKWHDPHCSLQQIKYKKLFCLWTKTDFSRLQDIHLPQTYESGPRAWSTTRRAPCSSTPRCFGQQSRTYTVKALSVVHNHHVPPPPPPAPWRIHEEGWGQQYLHNDVSSARSR